MPQMPIKAAFAARPKSPDKKKPHELDPSEAGAELRRQRELADAVCEAASGAATARVDSQLAENAGNVDLEKIVSKVKQANAAAGVQLQKCILLIDIRAAKNAKRLRTHLERLETLSLEVCAAYSESLRSLAARFVAQRESIAACLVEDLRGAELVAPRLALELEALAEQSRAKLTQRDERITQLEFELQQAQGLLAQEQCARAADQQRARNELGLLRAEVEAIEPALLDARRQLTMATAVRRRNHLMSSEIDSLRATLAQEVAARAREQEENQREIRTAIEEKRVQCAAWEERWHRSSAEAQTAQVSLYRALQDVCEEKDRFETALRVTNTQPHWAASITATSMKTKRSHASDQHVHGHAPGGLHIGRHASSGDRYSELLLRRAASSPLSSSRPVSSPHASSPVSPPASASSRRLLWAHAVRPSSSTPRSRSLLASASMPCLTP